MKSRELLSRAILFVLLGAVLAGCAVPRPGPVPTSTVWVRPLPTSTHAVSPLATSVQGVSPLPTVAPGGLAAPGPTSPVSPLSIPTIVSPLSTPTASATATFTPLPTPTVSPSPTATALIAVATRTRLPNVPTVTRALPAATRAPTLPPLPTRTPAPTQTPAPTIPPVQVTAWVSDEYPIPGEDVTVYGRLLVNGQPVAGAGMVAHWHLKGRYVDCEGDTGPDGVASCSVNTYGLPSDYHAIIQIFILYNEPAYRAVTQVTFR